MSTSTEEQMEDGRERAAFLFSFFQLKSTEAAQPP